MTAATAWSGADYRWMSRALQLAWRGLYGAHPNPRVGCVLTQDEAVVGEGWHENAGGPHAEARALEQAGVRARGAACYVTLEPCAHQGRTPPCAQALIEAGVGRVVVAVPDPDPRVRGRGLAALRAAGIVVAAGLLERQAERVNAGYLQRQRQRRPWVRCKLAASLDGRTAMADGESRWISSPQARADAQRLRARSSAILTGVGTVLADDPRLDVRDPGLRRPGRQPLRVVMDRWLRMPADARMLSLEGRTLVLSRHPRPPEAALRPSSRLDIVSLEGEGDAFLAAALRHLAVREQVNELLVEAGGRLSGALLQAGLVDELLLYLAPRLLGHEAQPLFRLPGLARLEQAASVEITDLRRIGADLRVTARITGAPGSGARTGAS